MKQSRRYGYWKLRKNWLNPDLIVFGDITATIAIVKYTYMFYQYELVQEQQ